jgi:hypothetical protein
MAQCVAVSTPPAAAGAMAVERRPPETSSYRVANRALAGRLPQRLRARSEAGASVDEITDWLHGQGISVSRETVRRWMRDLGVQRRGRGGRRPPDAHRPGA